MIRKAKFNYWQLALPACDRSNKVWKTIATLKNSSWSHLPRIRQVSDHISYRLSIVETFNYRFLSFGLFKKNNMSADSKVNDHHTCPTERVHNASDLVSSSDIHKALIMLKACKQLWR